MPQETETTIEDVLLIEERPLFILIDDAGHQVWLPRAEIRRLSKGPLEPNGLRKVTFTLPEWLARKELLG